MPEQIEPPGTSSPTGLRDIARILSSLYGSRRFWRLFLIILAIDLIGLTLGIGFLLMIHGFAMATIRAAVISEPARHLVTRISGGTFQVGGPPRSQLKAGFMLLHLLPTAAWLAMGIFGTWFILSRGFLQQNLIFLLVSG